MERATMTCDEFEEISGAYALDAVTPAERQAAEAHLGTGTSQSQNATIQLRYVAAQKSTRVIMHGLPQLQGTHVYQGGLLHLNRKNITGVTSVGLLNTQNGSATVSFAGNVTGYDA